MEPRLNTRYTVVTYESPRTTNWASYQGCKRDLNLRDWHIRFLVRNETETKTFLQFHETETRRLIFARPWYSVRCGVLIRKYVG